jgi:hypothetical protein
MTNPPPLVDAFLLADVADWIVPVIVVAFFIISHLWNAIKSVQQQAPQRRTLEKPLKPQSSDQRGAAANAGTQQPKPQQAGAGQGQLNAEIEEFLKRANERRGAKGGDQGKRQTSSGSASGCQQPARQSPPKAPLPSEKAASKQQRPAPASRRGFDTVAESVQQHLGERKFEQRESRLADDVVRAEQQLAQHVDQAFSNRLGNLAAADAATLQPAEVVVAAAVTDDPNSMARAMAGLLVNQQNLRQAILLKEILDRPVDRW